MHAAAFDSAQVQSVFRRLRPPRLKAVLRAHQCKWWWCCLRSFSKLCNLISCFFVELRFCW